ncbi:hypothetical protein, partial [Carboxydothermus pertinax]|uniref:hypothetical protein n=1 Tax=Carboxydothermus pertinax TaxID=870242 RepID=UPI001F33FE0C
NICLKEDFTAIKSQFAPKKCYFFSPLGRFLQPPFSRSSSEVFYKTYFKKRKKNIKSEFKRRRKIASNFFRRKWSLTEPSETPEKSIIKNRKCRIK